jgi:nitroreductase
MEVMMEVFDAIRTLLAVRSFQDKPVPEEVIRHIVEAGRLTGSSMNQQPWHFVVVTQRETLRRIGALAASGPYTAQAALAVVVTVEHSSPFGLSDSSRAIQSMMLAGWAEGVGSNWVGFYGLEALRPLLGIPETQDVVAVIPFGYPAKSIGAGKKKRKPLNEVSHRERFGSPFD